jgi:nucleoside-diphosphate-sugar epimerase
MKVAIFGATGTIGRSVTQALLERGDSVRVVSRSHERLTAAFGHLQRVEITVADVSDADGCRSAASGADSIVYSLGLPYTKEAFAAYPSMMRLAARAARSSGVRRMLLISNVYSYSSPASNPLPEEHPRNPPSVKGRHRKEQEDAALAAHQSGDFETLVLRLPDFYGPFADLSMGNMILAEAAAGGRANLLGPVDKPHEFVFTPDVGAVVGALLHEPTGWGRAYHLAGAHSITLRQFAELGFELAGYPPRIRVAGPWMVRLLGIFPGMMRELSEMSHLLTDPVILDDRQLRDLLGSVKKTPYREGVENTIESIRGR